MALRVEKRREILLEDKNNHLITFTFLLEEICFLFIQFCSTSFLLPRSSHFMMLVSLKVNFRERWSSMLFYLDSWWVECYYIRDSQGLFNYKATYILMLEISSSGLTSAFIKSEGSNCNTFHTTLLLRSWSCFLNKWTQQRQRKNFNKVA